MINIFKMIKYKNIKRNMEKYEITMEELKNKQKNGAIIIDVRSEQEYKEGYISGSINIPDYKLKNEILKRIPNKENEIIVYCSEGGRGRKAYKMLKNLQYINVCNLYGGIENY